MLRFRRILMFFRKITEGSPDSYGIRKISEFFRNISERVPVFYGNDAQSRCSRTQSYFAGMSVCKTLCMHTRSRSKEFRDRALSYHGLFDSADIITNFHRFREEPGICNLSQNRSPSETTRTVNAGWHKMTNIG